MCTILKIKQVIFSICLLFSLSLEVLADHATLLSSDFVQSFLKEYSQEERALLQDDLENIRKLCFRGISAPEEQKTYVATAGAPGAGKSTILETYLHDKSNFVYLDRDQRALKFMINTYCQELTNYKIRKISDMKILLQKAYEKWREGSVYIVSTLINEALEKGYNIAHGTTSTNEQVAPLFEQLKKNNYKIILMLCYSTEQNRENALQYRIKNQCFYQADPHEAAERAKVFPERFPLYFQYADEIQLYWIDHFLKGAVLAATLIKGQKMTLYERAALQKISHQYDQDRKGKKLESLQELIQKFER